MSKFSHASSSRDAEEGGGQAEAREQGTDRLCLLAIPPSPRGSRPGVDGGDG